MGVWQITSDDFTANRKVREILVTANSVQLNILQYGLGLFKVIWNMFLDGNLLLGRPFGESIGDSFLGWSRKCKMSLQKMGLPWNPQIPTKIPGNSQWWLFSHKISPCFPFDVPVCYMGRATPSPERTSKRIAASIGWEPLTAKSRAMLSTLGRKSVFFGEKYNEFNQHIVDNQQKMVLT